MLTCCWADVVADEKSIKVTLQVNQQEKNLITWKPVGRTKLPCRCECRNRIDTSISINSVEEKVKKCIENQRKCRIVWIKSKAKASSVVEAIVKFQNWIKTKKSRGIYFLTFRIVRFYRSVSLPFTFHCCLVCQLLSLVLLCRLHKISKNTEISHPKKFLSFRYFFLLIWWNSNPKKKVCEGKIKV